MKYIKFSLLAVVSLFLASVFVAQTASAQCVVVGPTIGGGEEVECNGIDPDGLTTTNFPDLVTVNPGATLQGTVNLRPGDDTLNIFGTTSANGSLNADDGNDIINVINGNMITAFGDCINAAPDDDTVTLDFADLDCAGPCGVNLASGNDILIMSDTQVSSNDRAVCASSGNDQITIGNNVLLSVNVGDILIDCGPDFDTITFAMDVPEGALPFISSQIAAATLPDGSITINGLFYEWEDCELLVNELGVLPSTVPTLSQWGLIAMAGILGIVGFMVIRRRKATA